ncbi:antitoxin VbhA family protein [Janthinobacterium sp. JC611]|uniref:antitoxin VbhA family protein n=1 Tax=Janthinobacterium sp. JC611 TaxID=2816201 RepID=UPI001BFCE6C0|nr:antitoxin VbhA family protein [Janthinobacterium sp. JC611]
MAKFTQQDRQRSVNQTLASWALEGFEPAPEYLALLERYVQGELTLAQVRAITDVQVAAGTDSGEKSPVLHAA